MPCCFVFVMVPLLLLYAIQQTRMIVRLVLLLRHPGRIAQFGLAARFVSGLCYWPVPMMLCFVVFMGSDIIPPDDASLLLHMTFTPRGAAFALCSWIAMTLWFRSIVNRALALYLLPTSLVPVAVLALLSLNYLAGFGWVFVRADIITGLFGTGTSSGLILIVLATAFLLLFIPAAPLVGFVLLIVHVVRVRAAKTWETTVPVEEEEIP